MIHKQSQQLLHQLIVLVIAGLLLWLAGDVVMALFGSLLVAVFLHGAAAWLNQRTGLSVPHALFAVVFSLALIAVTGGLLLAPRVADQVNQLSRELPHTLDQLTAALETNAATSWLLRQGESLGVGGQTDGGATGGGLTARVAGFAGTIVSQGFNAFVYFVLAVAIGLYLAASFNKYREGFVRLFAPAKRDRVGEIIGVSIHSLEGWLNGIAVSMIVLGVISYAGLSLLGVPLALTFALLTALLTFVPNLGAILSVIPPTLMGLTVSPQTSVYVLILYLVLQNVEGLIITPKVQARAASIPPPVLLTAQILMAALWGFYGLTVAAPLCAVGIVLVKMIYLEDRLGEHIEIPGYTSSAERTDAVAIPSTRLADPHLLANQPSGDADGGMR